MSLFHSRIAESLYNWHILLKLVDDDFDLEEEKQMFVTSTIKFLIDDLHLHKAFS